MRQEPWRQLELRTEGAAELYDVSPSRISALYPGGQIAIVGRYRGSGPMTFRLEGSRGGSAVVMETRADLSVENRVNPEIRRMWAERRAHDLLQGKRAGRLPESVERTVVQLGEDYSIVTPLTSFLVLETEEMFEQYGIERRTRALLEEEAEAREERARSADERVSRVGAERTRRPEPMDLGGSVDALWLGLILLLLAVGRRSCRAG